MRLNYLRHPIERAYQDLLGDLREARTWQDFRLVQLHWAFAVRRFKRSWGDERHCRFLGAAATRLRVEEDRGFRGPDRRWRKPPRT